MSQSAPVQQLTRAEELVNVGVELFHKDQLEPARLHFLAALALDPMNSIAWQNIAAVLRNQHRYDAAVTASRRSVNLTGGNNPYCLTNLGVALLGQKKHTDALRVLKQAAEQLVLDAPPMHNLGLIYYTMGKFREARACFETSLDRGYNAHCKSDLGLTLLSLGKIQEGMKEYEVRWDIVKKSRVWTFDIPEWKGEPLVGKHILVHHEQGFGDGIMLVRFLKQLASKHCHVTLAVPENLLRLFKLSFPFVSVVDINDEVRCNAEGGFDFHTPMMSLLRHLGITRPDEISADKYIIPPAELPFELPKAKRRVGICWTSGDHAPALRDRRRLVPLKLFLPLLENPNVSIISLQKGDDIRDIPRLGMEGIIFDLQHKLADFADTAAIISKLDLVISVDSAVAHLAGALGKPCLMLSPYTRCWRWWSIPSGRPWYDRMIVYPQASDSSWDKAMTTLVQRALWILKTDMR